MDTKFMVKLKNKDYPLFAGVLDMAHKAGLKSLTTEVIQIPSPENGLMAVVKARAEFDDGRVFEDIGDCSPTSTTPQLASSSIRLASTRAKGRVLRDAVNVGQTLLEELPDMHDAQHEPAGEASRAYQGRQDSAQSKPAAAQSAEGGQSLVCTGCNATLTKGQYEVSLRAYGRPMCPLCQRKEKEKAA